MNKDYYQNQIDLIRVDENDNVIGSIERWEAHNKGIIHRGFTAILKINDQVILQKRKHPAFDKYWDLSFSSHQYLKSNNDKSELESIYNSLEREWNVKKEDIIKINYLDKFHYRIKDPNSIFTEHEIDYLYEIRLKKPPQHNPEYAYGMSIIDFSKKILSDFFSKNQPAPWVEKMLELELIFY